MAFLSGSGVPGKKAGRLIIQCGAPQADTSTVLPSQQGCGQCQEKSDGCGLIDWPAIDGAAGARVFYHATLSESEMKTMRLIGSLAAVTAMTAVGSAFAAAEYATPAAGFVSSKSRADVQRELADAKADGSAASGRIDGDENAGARGPAGSRYSLATRAEVHDALTDFRTTHTGNTPNNPDDLYFGS